MIVITDPKDKKPELDWTNDEFYVAARSWIDGNEIKQRRKKKMTMPEERRRAVNRTREFLLELLRDESAPKKVREEASRCLKHYPGNYYMDLAKEQAPQIFGDWEDYYVKDAHAPEPFGDGDWDGGIIHDDG